MVPIIHLLRRDFLLPQLPCEYNPSISILPLPIRIIFARFLISTHYTHYEPWTFAICFIALIFNLFPKLPQVSLVRLLYV